MGLSVSDGLLGSDVSGTIEPCRVKGIRALVLDIIQGRNKKLELLFILSLFCGFKLDTVSQSLVRFLNRMLFLSVTASVVLH